MNEHNYSTTLYNDYYMKAVEVYIQELSDETEDDE